MQANGEINDVEMSWSTCETRVLSGSAASFTRFVTSPANASLVGEASWRASTDAGAVERKEEEKVETLRLRLEEQYHSLVQSIMLAGDTLRRATSIASLLVTFGIAIM